MYGPGVEKIFDELKEIFPKNEISIFSSDFMQNKKETEKLFLKISNNKIDILVGTQMVSKGFNFPKLNCIVVIDADFSGRGYDLRTTEKNIQLYHQLSGRAGRFSSQSLIIYQTLSPQDTTLNELIKNKSEELIKNELSIRKKNNLPPAELLNFVKNNEIGMLLLRIVELIGEDEILDLDPQTIYFINHLLIKSGLKKMSNKILITALPERDKS